MEVQQENKDTHHTTQKLLLIGTSLERLTAIQTMLLENRCWTGVIDVACSDTAGSELIFTEQYQAVLMDDSLSQSANLRLIHAATSRETPPALIMLTSPGNSAAGFDAVQAGAALYLPAAEITPPLLERAIRFAIAQKESAAQPTEGALLAAEQRLREIERLLHESESRFQLALRAVMGVVYDWDLRSNIVTQSEGLEQVVGYRPGEEPTGVDRWWPSNIHQEDYPRIQAELQKALASQQNAFAYEYRIRHAAGHWVYIWDQGYIVRDEQGQAVRVVGACTDITERKLAEEALHQRAAQLRESEYRFRTSVESLLDGFAILSAVREQGEIIDFRFDYINEKGCQMNNLSYEEHLGHRLLELLPEQKEAGLFAEYVQVVETGVSLSVETEDFEDMQNGQRRLWRSFEVRAVKLGDGFVVTWRNITQRKQTEEQLIVYTEKLAQSNKELEQFAFVASHDLQEPLRKIKMFGNSLQKLLHGKLPGQAEEYFSRMLNASARMEEMIHGLLELSRVNTRGGSFTQVDLEAVAQDVLSDLEPRIVSSAGQVQIDPLPTVQADPLQMRQLLQNLLSNGLKFHKLGVPPVLHVSADLVTPAGGKTDHVVLKITDNGIGFEEQYNERIFQPFQRLRGRTEFEGTGIGLAICYRIVERHHGTITARSMPGEGTTFLISLPVRQP